MADITLPLEILRATVQKPEELVFLVGAGLSVESGFPLWNQAAKNALALAKARGLQFTAAAYADTLIAKNKLYDVFDILHRELTPAAYRAVALEVFGKKSEASTTQRLLVSVPARGIITTNFDECLAAAAVHEHGETPLSVPAEILSSDRYFVYKPHGSSSDFSSMVLTNADWQKVLQRGHLRDILSQIVTKNQLVILGYGMGDPDFRAIWTDLMQTYVFRDTAIYCCSAGSISQQDIHTFRERNIQTIEFDDPHHSYAYIPALLRVLKQSAVTLNMISAEATPIPATVDKTVDDLERYVMLCMEFSPDSKSKLQLVCRAIILETLAERTDPVSMDQLLKGVAAALGNTSARITETAEAILQEMVTQHLVTVSATGLSLADNHRNDLSEKVSAARSKENAAIETLLTRFNKGSQPALDSALLIELVDRVIAYFGKEVAEFFLYSRPARIPNEQIETIIHDVCATRRVPAAVTARYIEAVKQFVLEPAEEYADVVFHKLQAYFITSAYLLDPTGTRLMEDYAKGHTVYLDSSIILPAMALGHPSQRLYQNMLSSTRRLGIRLVVARPMLNEVTSNIQTAEAAFDRFRRSGVALADILSGYIELQGKGRGNVFLEGFAAELSNDGNLSAVSYMRAIMGGSEILSEASTVQVLRERFGIEFDQVNDADLDAGEVNRLTKEITDLRTAGGRYKSELLCRHEAVQFALIHRRRKEDSSETPRVWFVTTDYFFSQLQKQERASYPLPVSYTPRMWLQYVSLLDYEARGEQNFGRLQQRMSYGVAAGNIGLSAIFQILHEKKDLLQRGLVTVKDMARAVVSEFHVRSSIEDYEFGTADKATIAATVRTAITKLALVKTNEMDKLVQERDAESERADLAERRLAKARYLRRVERAKKKQQGRKRRR